jgi:hypothetical protein
VLRLVGLSGERSRRRTQWRRSLAEGESELAGLRGFLQSRTRCRKPWQRRHRVGLVHVAARCLVERQLKHLPENAAGMRGAAAGVCCTRSARRWRRLRLERLLRTWMNPSASTRGGLESRPGWTMMERIRRDGQGAARGSVRGRESTVSGRGTAAGGGRREPRDEGPAGRGKRAGRCKIANARQERTMNVARVQELYLSCGAALVHSSLISPQSASCSYILRK